MESTVIKINPTLTISCGISGSGKSFKAQELLKEDPELVVCSADNFFIKNGVYQFNSAKLGEAHSICQFKAANAMAQKKSLYVDNTNLEFKNMEWYLRHAAIFGHEVRFLLFRAEQDDLPELVARNQHGVPERTIHRQYTKLVNLRKTLKKDMNSRYPGVKFDIVNIPFWKPTAGQSVGDWADSVGYSRNDL